MAAAASRMSEAKFSPAAVQLALWAAVLIAGCSQDRAREPAVMVPSAPRPVARPPDLAVRIDALAARALASPAAGVAIAVVWRGQTLHAKGYGLADVDQKRPVAADSIFRIASLSKTFTAVAVMKLVASGKLKLEDEIAQYMPHYPVRGNRITIRQLLTHTSGLSTFAELPWQPRHLSRTKARPDAVAAFATAPLDFEPGTRWQYSNAGYDLLALLAEQISGRSFPEYLKEAVLTPAGLTDTFYCPETPDHARIALGYRLQAGQLVRDEGPSMAHVIGAGSLCSTVVDLVAWSRALATHRVVDNATWTQMTTPVRLADGTTFPHGLGIAMGDLAGHASLGTRGSMSGYVTAVDYYPADDLHIAVLVNTAAGDLHDQLILDVARMVLDVGEPVVRDVPITAAEAAAIAGTYWFPSVGLSFAVSVENGAVMLRNTTNSDGLRLRSQGDGTYLVPERRRKVTFRIEGGKASVMKLEQGALQIEGTRTPAP